MAVTELQAANDYDDRMTAAVKSMLIEIGRILGSLDGKFAIIGGAVPWLLLGKAEMQHVGTADVDFGLDPVALGDGEYARLVESLQKHGYLQRQDLRRFQLVRTVPARDDGPDIDVIVDFLMSRDAEITKNAPPLVSQFAVQRADGADLALRFYQMAAVEDYMPDGDGNRVSIAVASIPALLAMKGYAIANRLKRKDAYDICYSVRNFPDGIGALVNATLPLLGVESALQGYRCISDKFRNAEDFGPASVRRFVEGSRLLGDRTADQWQQDAFGQVDAWLGGIGLRQP